MEQRVDTAHLREQFLEQVTELLRRHKLAAELERDGDDGGRRASASRSSCSAGDLDALQRELERLHPADVAYILEALPLDERLVVWDLVKADRDGEILLEVSDAVRETLIASMDEDELVAATEQLDTDEIADLAPDLPREVIQDVFKSLSVEEREQLRAAMSYDEDAVGALMDFDMVEVREDVTLEVVLRYLRRLDELPDHTDQLFVVDRDAQLKGLLPVNRLLVSPAEALVADVMLREFVQFNPREKAQDAAAAFERYDLVSAPVVDDDGRLVGRVTVNAVVDYIREAQDSEMLSAGGLREDEDLFASVWKSVKNRWTWLAVNLVTAFIASRVIGIFEQSIAQARRARRADADHRGHRRQLGQPDDHDDRARARARPDHARERAQALREGDRRERAERPHLGRRRRPVRVPDLPRLAARAS